MSEEFEYYEQEIKKKKYKRVYKKNYKRKYKK